MADSFYNHIADIDVELIEATYPIDSRSVERFSAFSGQYGGTMVTDTYYKGITFIMDKRGDFWRTTYDYSQQNPVKRFVDRFQGVNIAPFRHPLIEHHEWQRNPDIFDQFILDQLKAL